MIILYHQQISQSSRSGCPSWALPSARRRRETAAMLPVLRPLETAASCVRGLGDPGDFTTNGIEPYLAIIPFMKFMEIYGHGLSHKPLYNLE